MEKFAKVIVFNCNLLEDNEIRRQLAIHSTFSLAGTGKKNSGSCGGVRGGLINTFQSKMPWNEEEGHGLSGGGWGGGRDGAGRNMKKKRGEKKGKERVKGEE